ncbi:MAG: SGNH/GDSL hydrolase family protein [Lachnospiraceae bacterium]|nr:SGNH/GDSL hydrolase family protein [Lachnospiraceae bacterium]
MKRFIKCRLSYALAAITIIAISIAGCAGTAKTESTESSSGAASATASSNTSEASSVSSSDAVSDSSEVSSDAGSSLESAEDFSSNEVHTNPDDLKTIDVSKDIDPVEGAGPAASAGSSEEASSDGQTEQEWPDLGTPGPSDSYVTDDNGNQPHILVFGDSQFDNNRTADGLAQKLATYSHCKVYNCAIGGTGASPTQGYTAWNYDDWDSACFTGMALSATGKGNAEKICGNYYAYQVLKGCDLSDIDIVVVEYGVNDYFQDSPIGGKGSEGYLGAINEGIGLLKQVMPNATFVLCNPTYAQFFSNGTYVGDGNMLSNSYGPLVDYALSMVSYAQSNNYSYFNAYQWTNISSVNASEYLKDGVHMNHKGREIYAQYLSRIVLRTLGYSIPEGTDMTTFDYSTLQKTTTAQNSK